MNGIHACLYDEVGLSSPLYFLKGKLKIKEDKQKHLLQEPATVMCNSTQTKIVGIFFHYHVAFIR